MQHAVPIPHSTIMKPFWELPWEEQPRFGERPWACEAEEAQRYLNVPLLWPDEEALPEGMRLSTLTVRPEGETSWSSARLVLVGDGRQLRLKQFHYDWWRPTDLAVGLRTTRGFYRAGEGVVAWGRDFRGRAAARMAWGRTTVDLRIDRGAFVEWELRQLLAHLFPVVPAALPILKKPAFHEISYHVRRGYGPQNLDELAAASWTADKAAITTTSSTPILLPDPMPSGWRWDAASIWPIPPPQETQWLLRDEKGQNLFYARARPANDDQPLKLPPTYRIDEGWRPRQIMLRRRRATLAVQHPDLGGWSAAWAENGHRYQVFVRAGTLSGQRAFRDMIERLKPQ
ncbi:MAG: hypothetical protein M3220_15990 [Chloroflexota bacterium]|nr:hypothetical protein [Chloroflexota bacterium]